MFGNFFSKTVLFMKYCSTGQDTDDDMAHTRCMLDA
jgi:hypothetical protein